MSDPEPVIWFAVAFAGYAAVAAIGAGYLDHKGEDAGIALWWPGWLVAGAVLGPFYGLFVTTKWLLAKGRRPKLPKARAL